MTTLSDLERRLGDLLSADLLVLGERFAVVGLLPDYPRAAALGERMLWLIAAEVYQRRGQARPGDEPPTPDRLSIAELLALRAVFTGLAAAHPDALALGSWCRAFADFATLTVLDLDPGDADGDDGAALGEWVAARRRERPHGTPGDVTGIAPWT